MGRLMDEGLLHIPNKEARAVWSWPEADKLSSQWLLVLPGYANTLTSAEFAECAAALLRIPSPACASLLGVQVGRRAVDLYCDAVMAEAVSGDGWRKRHDQVKMRLLGLLRWAGIEVDCEVFNLFSGLIPQRGLARIEKGRKRRGLVPDFRVRLPAAGGRPDDDKIVLAELKWLGQTVPESGSCEKPGKMPTGSSLWTGSRC